MALIRLLFSCLTVSTVTITTAGGSVRTLTSSSSSAKTSTTLFLLTGYKPPLPPPPAGPKVAPKAAEVEDGEDPPIEAAELPPKPLPQTMLPRNMTAADALKPPLGAAQVAPPPRRLVDVDVCRYNFLFCSIKCLLFTFIHKSGVGGWGVHVAQRYKKY